ncbi:hypothetical protein CHUAL_012766 [Chamberlinius hualienensis]
MTFGDEDDGYEKSAQYRYGDDDNGEDDSVAIKRPAVKIPAKTFTRGQVLGYETQPQVATQSETLSNVEREESGEKEASFNEQNAGGAYGSVTNVQVGTFSTIPVRFVGSGQIGAVHGGHASNKKVEQVKSGSVGAVNVGQVGAVTPIKVGILTPVVVATPSSYQAVKLVPKFPVGSAPSTPVATTSFVASPVSVTQAPLRVTTAPGATQAPFRASPIKAYAGSHVRPIHEILQEIQFTTSRPQPPSGPSINQQVFRPFRPKPISSPQSSTNTLSQFESSKVAKPAVVAPPTPVKYIPVVKVVRPYIPTIAVSPRPVVSVSTPAAVPHEIQKSYLRPQQSYVPLRVTAKPQIVVSSTPSPSITVAKPVFITPVAPAVHAVKPQYQPEVKRPAQEQVKVFYVEQSFGSKLPSPAPSKPAIVEYPKVQQHVHVTQAHIPYVPPAPPAPKPIVIDVPPITLQPQIPTVTAAPHGVKPSYVHVPKPTIVHIQHPKPTPKPTISQVEYQLPTAYPSPQPQQPSVVHVQYQTLPSPPSIVQVPEVPKPVLPSPPSVLHIKHPKPTPKPVVQPSIVHVEQYKPTPKPSLIYIPVSVTLPPQSKPAPPPKAEVEQPKPAPQPEINIPVSVSTPRPTYVHIQHPKPTPKPLHVHVQQVHHVRPAVQEIPAKPAINNIYYQKPIHIPVTVTLPPPPQPKPSIVHIQHPKPQPKPSVVHIQHPKPSPQPAVVHIQHPKPSPQPAVVHIQQVQPAVQQILVTPKPFITDFHYQQPIHIPVSVTHQPPQPPQPKPFITDFHYQQPIHIPVSVTLPPPPPPQPKPSIVHIKHPKPSPKPAVVQVEQVQHVARPISVTPRPSITHVQYPKPIYIPVTVTLPPIPQPKPQPRPSIVHIKHPKPSPKPAVVYEQHEIYPISVSTVAPKPSIVHIKHPQPTPQPQFIHIPVSVTLPPQPQPKPSVVHVKHPKPAVVHVQHVQPTIQPIPVPTVTPKPTILHINHPRPTPKPVEVPAPTQPAFIDQHVVKPSRQPTFVQVNYPSIVHYPTFPHPSPAVDVPLIKPELPEPPKVNIPSIQPPPRKPHQPPPKPSIAHVPVQHTHFVIPVVSTIRPPVVSTFRPPVVSTFRPPVVSTFRPHVDVPRVHIVPPIVSSTAASPVDRPIHVSTARPTVHHQQPQQPVVISVSVDHTRQPPVAAPPSVPSTHQQTLSSFVPVVISPSQPLPPLRPVPTAPPAESQIEHHPPKGARRPAVHQYFFETFSSAAAPKAPAPAPSAAPETRQEVLSEVSGPAKEKPSPPKPVGPPSPAVQPPIQGFVITNAGPHVTPAPETRQEVLPQVEEAKPSAQPPAVKKQYFVRVPVIPVTIHKTIIKHPKPEPPKQEVPAEKNYGQVEKVEEQKQVLPAVEVPQKTHQAPQIYHQFQYQQWPVGYNIVQLPYKPVAAPQEPTYTTSEAVQPQFIPQFIPQPAQPQPFQPAIDVRQNVGNVQFQRPNIPLSTNTRFLQPKPTINPNDHPNAHMKSSEIERLRGGFPQFPGQFNFPQQFQRN